MGGDALILLDTHALYWLDQNDPALGARASATCDDAMRAGELGVSALSFWEIALLIAKGRIELRRPMLPWREDLLAAGLVEIAVDGAVGIEAASLGGFHADPADRIIVATAAVHRATLITADRRILGWDGDVDRQDARL